MLDKPYASHSLAPDSILLALIDHVRKIVLSPKLRPMKFVCLNFACFSSRFLLKVADGLVSLPLSCVKLV